MSDSITNSNILNNTDQATISCEKPKSTSESARPRRVALITGASSGIGQSTAKALLERGWVVYGAARRVERLRELSEHGLRSLYLDVTQPASCAACLAKVIEEAGQIDALINNAGYGSFGSVEEISNEEAHHQFEVNVFGLANMIREVLPFMRQAEQGRIVNVASMGAKVYTPMGGWYYASKSAVEILSDSLRQEVSSYGIKVILIEPGVIKSEWPDIAVRHMQETSQNGPYAKLCAKMSNVLKLCYGDNFVGSPDYVARMIVKALNSPCPRQRYAGPWDAKFLLFIKKYLPDAAFDLIVRLICT